MKLVALNVAEPGTAFDRIRAAGVEVVHARHRVAWEEISARRRGEPAPVPEEISVPLGEALHDADIVFGFYVPRALRALAPRLRWLETPSTGVDHLRGTALLESDVRVTTVGGLFAPVIAEHVFAGLLYFAKRLAHFEEQRRRRIWQMGPVGSLEGKTLAILGVGNIGREVARRACAFGMHVLGVGRDVTPQRAVAGIDRLYGRADLRAVLAEADFVAVAVAETAETRCMIGAAELEAMRDGAVLVNVARGTVIDESALIAALRSGKLAGAALDVFAEEPLPQESPLWSLPNALVTPHVAVLVEDYMARALEHLADNVANFLAGRPLRDCLDRDRGY
jgi:phosphoglycerate dehydrogenase-like enzyme